MSNMKILMNGLLVRQLMDINIGIEDLVPNAENGIFKRMNDG